MQVLLITAFLKTGETAGTNKPTLLTKQSLSSSRFSCSFTLVSRVTRWGWLFWDLPKHPLTAHSKSGLATRSQYKQAAATLPLTCLTDWAKALFKTVKGTLAFPPRHLIKCTWGSEPTRSMSMRETCTCMWPLTFWPHTYLMKSTNSKIPINF